MATKKELAKDYLDRIIRSELSPESIRKIIEEIKNLTYEGSENNISISDRVEIVNNIKELLEEKGISKGIRTFSKGGRLVEARSNDEFLDLIDYVLDQVKK